MISRYQISDGIFADLTRGASSPTTIAFLRSSQITKHKLLLRHVRDSLPEDWTECHRAIGVLIEAQRRDQQVLTDLMASPFVGAWAAWCTRRVRGSVTSPTPLRTDFGYLCGLAAVAAARSGLDTRLSLPVHDGRLFFPTLGSLQLGAGVSDRVLAEVYDGRIRVDVDGEPVRVPEDPAVPSAGWWPVHRLRVEADKLVLTVMLDDLDPYRDCYRKPLAGRLTLVEVEHWAAMLQQAWGLLVRRCPGRAHELIGGLCAVVPLSIVHAEPGLSATSRMAFGALAATIPRRPAHLAATMVHEFQHSKLSALLDLLPLYDAHATDLYFAPWRSDPRPIGGLLQGAYAFLAVAQLWHDLRDRTGITPEATRNFAELREQVRQALETLDRSPHLNVDGHQFLAGLHAALAPQLAVRLPASLERSARESLSETYSAWRERNQR